MSPEYLIKETAPFVQFSSVKVTDAFNALFDIEKVPEETINSYCQKLFSKAITLNNSKIPAFLNHHCGLVIDSLKWLNKFEKLLSLNEEIFHEAKRDSKLIKFQVCIENKRNQLNEVMTNTKTQKPAKKYINAESEDRYFSFYELRKELKKLESDAEKIILLTSEKFEYQQSCIEFLNVNTLSYTEQCDKEIEHIYAMKKLKEELHSAGTFSNSQGTFFPNIISNLNINQLSDIFYQLSTQKGSDGKPYIVATTNQIADFIVKNFLDRDGNPISPQTVKTILKPSKEDKRPNTGKRIDLQSLLRKT